MAKVKSPAVILKGKQGKDRRAFGDPVKADVAFNCLSCMYRPSCGDPNKNFNYRCTKWSSLPDLGSFFDEKIDAATPSVMIDDKTPLDKIKEREYSEVDLIEMVEQGLNTAYDVLPTFEIDDRDLAMPPNFFTWFTEPRFIGQEGIKLWAMQIKMTSEYLGEYCPRCSDLKYLDKPKIKHSNSKFLERVQLLEFGICPRCKSTKSEMTKTGELPNYYRMAAVLGQRSGKNALSTSISSYNHALWNKLPSPQGVYGLPRQQYLNATYVALTFAQAKKNYWDPFKAILDNSRWYGELHELLDYYGEKHGKELYQVKDIFLRYTHKGLYTYISGPNKRTLRGDTRSEVAGDEFGWFPVSDDQDDKERMGGPEIVTALGRSLKTLTAKHRKLLTKKGYNHIPKPIFTMISSPQELNDVVMTELRSSVKSKVIYGIQKATWEINPELPRSEFDEDFEKDADKAMRDFGAQPPLSSMAWIKEMDNAVGAFTGKRNHIRLSQKQFINASGIKQTTANAKIRKPSNGARVLAIDAGYTNNSFAFAVGSLQDGIPVCEGVGEIIPSRKAPINFTHVYRGAISELIQEKGVQILVSDRWQNIRTHQDAEEDYGVLPVEMRLKYPQFEAVREAIYNGEYILPRLEDDPTKIHEMGADGYPDSFIDKPVMHLLFQILTVRDYPGQSVEKGGKTTDDIFRAMILLYTVLMDSDYASMLHERTSRGKMVLGGFFPGNHSSAGNGQGSTTGKLGGVFNGGKAGMQGNGSTNSSGVGGSFGRSGGR